MTSTSFNIGFIETKNSSRVLKPPGGGHSDIFGVRGDTEVQNPMKRKNHPLTTITSCFAHEEITIKPTIPINIHKELEKKEDMENGNQNGSKTEDMNENTEPTKDNEVKRVEVDESDNKNASIPRRVRVPPGGFSSGLW